MCSRRWRRRRKPRAPRSSVSRKAARATRRRHSTAHTSRRSGRPKTQIRLTGSLAARLSTFAGATSSARTTTSSLTRPARWRSATWSPWPVPHAISCSSETRCSFRNRCRECIRERRGFHAWNIFSKGARRFRLNVASSSTRTLRLHPSLCGFVSAAIYDGRLHAHPHTAERYLVLQPGAPAELRPAGLVSVEVDHQGCTQSSVAEAEVVAKLVDVLLKQNARRADGTISSLAVEDILVVAPFNMQVNLLKQRLPSGARVGTVDKFQGQEAAVVIVSMTTSRGDEAPRGTEFLFNRNRFNVAISRAQCLAVIVRGRELLEGTWGRIEDLRRLNLFAYADEVAEAGG